MMQSRTDCECEFERLLTRQQTFLVAPKNGGGWDAWKGALSRLLDSLISGPTHCLVLTQEPTERYVQLIVGHDGVRIEVSGNLYLTGDFQLGPTDDRCLAKLGFQPGDEDGHDGVAVGNWWMQQRPAHPIWIAELVAFALVEIAAFERDWPITIDMFGCSSPCTSCAWGAPATN